MLSKRSTNGRMLLILKFYKYNFFFSFDSGNELVIRNIEKMTENFHSIYDSGTLPLL